MFTTSAICSRRHRLEVDLHPRRKKNVIIIYTQSQISRSRQPNEPELWVLVSIYVEGCDFLGEVFSFELFYTEA